MLPGATQKACYQKACGNRAAKEQGRFTAAITLRFLAQAFQILAAQLVGETVSRMGKLAYLLGEIGLMLIVELIGHFIKDAGKLVRLFGGSVALPVVEVFRLMLGRFADIVRGILALLLE